jgi:pentatricopeptide repeat protein
MYNSLMLCYARRHEPQKAEEILREMKSLGMKPDVVNIFRLYNIFRSAIPPSLTVIKIPRILLSAGSYMKML